MTVETTGWNESIPVAGDLVAEGPDNFRAVLIRVRARMAHEHAWPSSQTASGQAGYHTFITLSGQTSAPTLTYGTFTTQLASIYVSSGSKSVMVADSAGTAYVLVKSGVGPVILGGTAGIGDIPYITSGGGAVALSPGSSGQVLVSAGTTTAPTWGAIPATTDKVIGQVANSIIQHSTGTISSSTIGVINFGTNFANTAYGVVVSWENLGGSVSPEIAPTIRAKAVGSVTVFNGNGASLGVCVMAVGSAG